MKNLHILSCLTFCLLLIAGCGGPGLPEGETGTVTGTVMYKGTPVPEGTTVTFMRTEGGYIAIGTTNAQGEYTLGMKDGKDILVGKYRVSVTAPMATSTMSEDELNKKAAEGKLEQLKSAFPAKYSSPEASPLTAEVKTGENKIPLTLED